MNTGDSRAEVISLDDSQLIELLRTAQRKIFFAGPGMSLPVAQALCEQWPEIGAESVSVLLDIDPETCRLGYGSIDAVSLLNEVALKMGRAIHHRPGMRIGLLICDETTIVFSPLPLLIESESNQFPRPNGVRFDALPTAGHSSIPLEREVEDLIQGGDRVGTDQVEQVKNDLAENPPLKFDLAQRVRVFNARFEFVDFELTGLSISRKRAAIPSDLMGLAKDRKTQNLLHGTINLIPEDSELSGERINRLKKTIAEKYLVALKGYGNIVLRSNKQAFEKSIKRLQRCVEWFQKQVREKLQSEMDANRKILVETLLPAVAANPPRRWVKSLGQNPSADQLRCQLDAELATAFGNANDVTDAMKIRVVFKGVTYESLNDPNFVDIAAKAIPSLRFLHEEYDATKASSEPIGTLDS